MADSSGVQPPAQICSCLSSSSGYILSHEVLNPFIVTSAAIVDSINPCAISVLLLTIGFLFSLGKTRVEVLKIGFSYIIGIYVAYILIGVGMLRALSLFGVPHSLAKFGALIIITTGLIGLAESLIPNFPIHLKIPDRAHSQIAKLIYKGSWVWTFAMGALVGMYEFPCTGGPYLFILSLLHDKATFFQGFLYLIYYNIIFVLPLVLILLILGNEKIMAKINAVRKNNSKRANILSSFVMILLGLVILLTA